MELVQSHMDHLSQKSLGELMAITGTPCISIYMPTHLRGAETQQDPIRLKNLLSKVQNDLLGAGKRRPDVVQLLEPAEALLDEYEFWQHQSQGLALFCTPEQFVTYRLPVAFDELALVSDHAHIKPLLPLFVANGHFYLLALSQNEVRFFEGTRFQIGEMNLDDTPLSLVEAMRFDEFDDQLQFHTQTGMNADGGRSAMFHGHSDAGDEAVIKENMKRFLHRVDEGVRKRASDEQVPLVLSGVESIRGLYREVSHYRNLVESGIDGNPELVSPQELHKEAWTLVEPLFEQAQQDALDLYLQLAGNQDARATTELEVIVSAAYFQRVDTLFVPLGRQAWGKFDFENNRVHVYDAEEGGAIDLFDFAASHTLLNGGTVYALQLDQMPDSQMVAAIFRY